MKKEIAEEAHLLGALLNKTWGECAHALEMLIGDLVARSHSQDDLPCKLFTVGLTTRSVFGLHVEVQRTLRSIGLPADGIGALERLLNFVVATAEVPLSP